MYGSFVYWLFALACFVCVCICVVCSCNGAMASYNSSNQNKFKEADETISKPDKFICSMIFALAEYLGIERSDVF